MASKKEKTSKEQTSNDEAVVTVDMNKLLIPLAIVVAGLMVSAVIYFTNNSDSEADTTSPSVQGAVDDGADGGAGGETFEAASTTIDDDAIKGDKNAKVAIVEFSDFECPFCQRHYQETYSQLLSNYIDTGDVMYVFRDYPLGFHPQAVPAATAANCAREQGGDDGYYAYHDALYEGDVASSTTDTYVAIATDQGLDSAKFKTCLESDKYADEIDSDMADGSAAGVTGTPGFVIGIVDGDGNVVGKRIAGAYPYADFEAIIEEYLAQ